MRLLQKLAGVVRYPSPGPNLNFLTIEGSKSKAQTSPVLTSRSPARERVWPQLSVQVSVAIMRKQINHQGTTRQSEAAGEGGPVGGGRRGRPQAPTDSPLGNLILQAMRLLGLGYQQVVAESKRLAALNDNPAMRIGKSTLGNIISGRIRQPGSAKLDSLRVILHLTLTELDIAMGLQPDRRFADQLQMNSTRTHEVAADAVTRQRMIRIPILRQSSNLNRSQFLEGLVERWTEVEVEYLSHFYPPHCRYVVVGDDDTFASPVIPPGSRLLVNTLLTNVPSSEDVSYYEREIFYILTPQGFTCSYLEYAPGDRIVLVPHPQSGRLREVYWRAEVKIVGQVTGLLFSRTRH